MRENIIFIITKNLKNMNIFGDLEGLENVYIQTVEGYNSINRFERMMRKIIFNNNIEIPFKLSWYQMFGIPFYKNEKYYFLIDSGVLRFYPYVFWQKISKKSNIYLNLLLFNSMDASSPNIKDFKNEIINGNWNEVYTYDKYDAEKYGWNYFGLSYFSKPKEVKNTSELSDIYFVGGLKGNRDSLILDTFKTLHSNGIKCTFDLYCYSDKQYSERKYDEFINYYRKWKCYDEIQKEIVSTNCILEILQEGQRTQSVRYFEAIFYNKKLLTNNPNIFNLPFYDERYMHYFSKPEDIDLEWVRNCENIDYGYNGEFSTLKLLEKIKFNIKNSKHIANRLC